MLKIWTHPKTHASRVYFNFDAIKSATNKVKGGWRYKDVKVWMESAKEGGIDIHTIIKGDETIADALLDEFQAAILDCVGLSGREAWEEVISIAESFEADEGSSARSKRGDDGESTKSSRVAEARNLDLARVPIKGKIKLYMSNKEPELMRSLLSTNPAITIRRVDLDIADYRVEDESGNVLLIERQRCTDDGVKTDFERALKSKNKLFNKTDALSFLQDQSENHVLPFLILEGDVFGNSQGLMLSQIDGAIAFLSAAQRISVLSTVNANHSAHVILKLANAFISGELRQLSQSKQKSNVLLEQKLNVLRSLPGIDEHLAADLLKHFGSVGAIAKASQEELSAIKGVGAKRASAISKVLGAV
jgi:ERCC4-type nuclease